MSRSIAAIVLLMFAFAAAATAGPAKESVEADASTRQVAITSSYTGTEILVFGTVENSVQPSAEAGTYDVVVVVEGAAAPVVVRYGCTLFSTVPERQDFGTGVARCDRNLRVDASASSFFAGPAVSAAAKANIKSTIAAMLR